MTPLVSVLCVTYNHEKFIAELIESVLSQTYRDLELVVADDGSTDGAPAIIRRYAAQDARVKPVLGAQNEGLPANFNRAIGRCRGEFIAIIAGDDVMMPDKIEAQVSRFSDRQDCGVLSHDSLVMDERGNTLYRWSDRHKPLVGGVETLFRTNWLLQKDHRPAPPSLMFRRAFMLAAPYDVRLPNSNEWLHPIACSMARPDLKWGYLPKVLSKYRRYGRQTSQDPAIGRSNFEERMLVLSVASSRYPQIGSLIRACRAYEQFKFIVFGWHPPALKGHYEKQFLKEAGFFRWLYMRCVHFLLNHPVWMDSTRPLRKLIIRWMSLDRAK